MVEEAKIEVQHLLSTREDTEKWLADNQIQFQVSEARSHHLIAFCVCRL